MVCSQDGFLVNWTVRNLVNCLTVTFFGWFVSTSVILRLYLSLQDHVMGNYVPSNCGCNYD